jgi:hypothetical protein
MCPIELFSGQGPSPEDEAWVQMFHDVVMDSVRVFAETESAQLAEAARGEDDEPDFAQNDGDADLRR